MNESFSLSQSQWTPTVILVDADYLDRLVFDMTVNFEMMLKRRIPKADIPMWADCLALDGGLQPGENVSQVLFLYSKGKETLQNCTPSSLKTDLDQKAFHDKLGEFQFSSFPVEEKLCTRGQLYVQSLEVLLSSSQVKRLLLVPDMEEYGQDLRAPLREVKDKQVTLFSTQPVAGFRCPQEILTYSLLAALGIHANEFDEA